MLRRQAHDALFEATLAGARRALVTVAVFSFFINILMLTAPLYMMQLFDRVLTSRSYSTLVYLTLIALVALLVYAVLESVRGAIMTRISTWMDRRLAPEAFTRAVAFSLRSRQPQSRVLKDLHEVRNLFTGPTMMALFDTPWVPVYLVVIWLISAPIALVALIGALVSLGLTLLNEAVTRQPLRQAGEAASKALQQADASLRNAEVVQAMGMTPSLVGRWMRSQVAGLAMQERAGDRAGRILAAAKFWRFSIQIFVYAVGGYYVLEHSLSSGGMMAASILMGRMLAPIDSALVSWKQFTTSREAYRRLKAFFTEVAPAREGARLPPPEGHLEIGGLHYVYPGAQVQILRGVSFAVEPGEVLAIVGPSAAGKSTLARLLIGLYEPSRGSVRLDGAEISAWDRTELGRHLGYLPQDVELFAGTVAENIARMAAAPIDEVIEAARLAGVHEMILRLANGYETDIGDSGTVLSGGQRQRIGLARALFGKPRVIVLDEPNANLDIEGEQALQKAIQAMKEQGSTIVMIAHRPSMLAHVDRILVMRAGMIEAIGERNEILRQITRPQAVTPLTPQTPGQGAQPQGRASA